jgi:hypothetical protein
MNEVPFKHLTVLQFSKHLPGIDRDAFRAMFDDPFSLFIANKPGLRFLTRRRINGQTLSMQEVEGIHRRRVDAKGAAAIVRLYLAGALPMTSGNSPIPLTTAIGYVGEAETFEREKKVDAEKSIAVRRGYLENPSTVPETEFGLGLLNDIFMRYIGPCGGIIQIGGVAVTKTQPNRHISNSGSSRDWSYHFLWTSADGTDQRISRDSRHAGNRRNDPERNNGLGRE